MLELEFLEQMRSDIGDNSSRRVDERDLFDGGLLFHSEFQQALDKVQWTQEQKTSGSALVHGLFDKLSGKTSDKFLK